MSPKNKHLDGLSIQDLVDWAANAATPEAEAAIRRDMDSEHSQILALFTKAETIKDKLSDEYPEIFDRWIRENREAFPDRPSKLAQELAREMSRIRESATESVSIPTPSATKATAQSNRSVAPEDKQP